MDSASNQTPNSRTPLLPQHVYQTHRLVQQPIRFPSAGGTRSANSEPGETKPHDNSTARYSDVPSTSVNAFSDLERDGVPKDQERLPGLPKVTRECLIAEIQCYGKYIVPVLLVFGLGGVMLALWISKMQ